VERYAQSGEGDVLQLTDIDPPEYRLRVGDWRVRFHRDSTRAILILLRVLPRDKAY
jgi:mRNA-degrading endonuclease RelE of RelBE toxin-antitoxin system